MPKWLSRGFNGASGACLNQHRRVGLVHAASCYSVLTENYYVLLQDAGSNFSCKEHGCHFLPVKCRTMKCFFHVHACDQVNLPCGKKDFYYAEMSGRIYWLCLVDDLDWILRSWSSENMTPCQKSVRLQDFGRHSHQHWAGEAWNILSFVWRVWPGNIRSRIASNYVYRHDEWYG